MGVVGATVTVCVSIGAGEASPLLPHAVRATRTSRTRATSFPVAIRLGGVLRPGKLLAQRSWILGRSASMSYLALSANHAANALSESARP